MKNIERQKIESIISRIERNAFSSLDVDNLLSKIREFCEKDSRLQEITHFCAHNSIRDRGLSIDFLKFSKSSLEYYFQYACIDTKHKTLDYTKPLERIVIENALFTTKFVPIQLLAEKNLSKDIFNQKTIRQNLEYDLKNDTYTIKKNASEKFLLNFKSLNKYIFREPLYTDKDFFNDIINKLKELDFDFKLENFTSAKDKLIVFTLLNLHETEINIGDNKNALLLLTVSKPEINSLPSLTLTGKIPIKVSNARNQSVLIPIFLTEIDPKDWLSEKLYNFMLSKNITCGLSFDESNNILDFKNPDKF